MKVILIESIRNLGNISEEIKVKKGFGRYLINSRKALYSTKANASLVQSNLQSLENKKNLAIQDAEKMLPSIKEREIRFIRECQENLRLFGSVTKKDILSEIKKIVADKNRELQNLKLTVENINLANPIKSVGIFSVNVNLGHNIATNVIVNVAHSEEIADSNITKMLEENKKAKALEEQRTQKEEKKLKNSREPRKEKNEKTSVKK